MFLGNLPTEMGATRETNRVSLVSLVSHIEIEPTQQAHLFYFVTWLSMVNK